MAGYEASQTYQFSAINYLPRHVVPTADVVMDKDKGSIVALEKGPVYSLPTNKYGNPQFLTELSSCQPLQLEPAFNSWQHHQKSLAQDIVPFLWVGPMAVARDPKFIQSNQITMLIAVRDGKAAKINPKIMNPTRYASAEGIETAIFDMFDESDLIRRFDVVLKQMNDHLLAKTTARPVTKLDDVGGRILLFCEAGDKRSPALAALFFMVVFGLSTINAVQAIQARRYGININGNLYRLLQSYGELLTAERQVAAMANQDHIGADGSTKRTLKRTIDEAQEEDDTMDVMDEEDCNVREGMAPFRTTST